ncbi:hypothetical protein HGO23_14400 [Xenorhabdus budapestensis]|uniref:DUF6602 domain-containing protein n=1 Tax=Xenorhabdus budapestensis TaxID=290110 RepID=A0ABX7VE90_XENBU|nr:DUF6602 domain-containing protein [Xenorhabdus budapestensis]QTL39038.1 hypothetical protein HGO23_14400 [Xenorhabdus budapestensis]
MIKNIAELLQAFMNEETAKLNTYELKHGPTIGDMYEGLSTELLNRAIPPQLNLQIVDGFVTDGDKFLSGQMDCMLVRGEGEKIPYTNSYKWHVKDVLVVFEVKKNLYSKDLINSFYKLRQVTESYFNYLFEGKHEENKTIDLSPSYKTFSQITGVTAPSYHDRETLTQENELIYTTVFMEQLMPVKIVLGYDGFSSEFALREGLIKFLEEKAEEKGKGKKGEGYGVPSFPQLIICGKHSLVKSNGRPYLSPMRDGYWDFMMSSKANPVLLMLELIWTKLSFEFDIGMPWGDDIEIERLNEFLRAKPVINEDQGGWMLKYDVLSKDILESRESSVEWKPVEIPSSIYTIFCQLTQSNVCTKKPDFIEFAEREFESVSKCVNEITSTNLASFDGEFLSLNAENLITAVLPDGRFVIAENSSGRFEAWLKRRL